MLHGGQLRIDVNVGDDGEHWVHEIRRAIPPLKSTRCRNVKKNSKQEGRSKRFPFAAQRVKNSDNGFALIRQADLSKGKEGRTSSGQKHDGREGISKSAEVGDLELRRDEYCKGAEKWGTQRKPALGG